MQKDTLNNINEPQDLLQDIPFYYNKDNIINYPSAKEIFTFNEFENGDKNMFSYDFSDRITHNLENSSTTKNDSNTKKLTDEKLKMKDLYIKSLQARVAQLVTKLEATKRELKIRNAQTDLSKTALKNQNAQIDRLKKKQSHSKNNFQNIYAFLDFHYCLEPVARNMVKLQLHKKKHRIQKN